MPRSRFEPDRAPFRARRSFTDREEQRSQFAVLLNAMEHDDALTIWSIYGLPGIGKSRLLAEFRTLCRKRSAETISVAFIDFRLPHLRSAEDALLTIWSELKYGCDLFEFGFARYWSLLGRPVEALRGDRRVSKDGLLIDMLDYGRALGSAALEAGEAIPGLPLLLKLGKAAHRTTRRVLHRHRKLLEQCEDLNANELRERLPYLLGRDIADAAEAGNRTVLLFDAYEDLIRTSGGRFYIRDRGDQWLRDLLAPCRRTLAVISAREPLDWAESTEEGWEDVLRHHRLRSLSDDDVRKFLTSIPISEASLREAIVATAHGSPLYVDLCVDVYERARRAGTAITTDDMGPDLETVLSRFLRGCTLPERSILRALAIPPLFEEELFVFLTGALGTGYPTDAFRELCRYSFVDQVGATSYYRLHESVSVPLISSLKPNRKSEVERCIHSFSEKLLARTGGEWWQKEYALELEASVAERVPDAQVAAYGASLALVGAGYGANVDRIRRQYLEARESLQSLNRAVQALVLRRFGRIQEAAAKYEGVDYSILGVHAEFAKFHRASVLRIGGDYRTAQREYERIYRDSQSKSVGSLAGKQLADLAMLRGDFVAARELLEQLLKQAPSAELRAELLRQLGHVYRWTGMWPEARKQYSMASEIARERGLLDLSMRLGTNLLEGAAFFLQDPKDLSDKSVARCERFRAVLELGKVRCARALIAATQLGRIDVAREELSMAYRCFRRVHYSAGFVFCDIVRSLLAIVEGEEETLISAWRRAAARTRKLGVYGFLVVALAEALPHIAQTAVDQKPVWLNEQRISDQWGALVAACRQG